jgi:2-polyprenyl-3-methyl-5-hydroxy-6-metoxy-1,4-benzoquinol methylase
MAFTPFPDMRSRLEQEELMDRSSADVGLLLRTIRQFRLINTLLSSSRRLIRSCFFKKMASCPKREYTMLDLGAGGCDIAVWAVKEARQRGLKLRVTAIDHDKRIRGLAEEAVARHPGVTFLCRSALDLSGLEDFDFIFSNHFLHHLGWEDLSAVIDASLKKARVAFLFNDLKRSNLSYLGYAVFAILYCRGSFAFTDGLLSIRRGFLPDELKAFIEMRFPGAGIRTLTTHPGRIVLYCEKNPARGCMEERESSPAELPGTANRPGSESDG